MVNKFIQKTCLELDEGGTKAYASLLLTIEKPGVKEIISLNRPFLYAIYDRQKEIPLFLGAMTNISDKKIELNHLKDEVYERYKARIHREVERLKILFESEYTDRLGFLGEIWGGIWYCMIDDTAFRFRIYELDEITETCKVTIYTNGISHGVPVTIKGVIRVPDVLYFEFENSSHTETQWEGIEFFMDDPRCSKCKLLLKCSQIKRITDDNLHKFISAMADKHLDMMTLYREN